MARRLRCRWLVRFVPVLLLMNSVLAAPPASLDIKSLSLEELMEIDVYSASRRLEPVQGIPSAAYVLTGEDIRRSRAQSIPEVLRLVPGVNVARVDASRWAISIRGFNERITHNIQVLIDGRSIYDPLFAGTFWEMQDTLLEDIERIEVVRGPGGTLWGPHAVNGVINIITKHAANTQGGLTTAGAGTEERAFGAARYGWQTGEKQYARVYAKSFDRGPGFTSAPSPQARERRGRTRRALPTAVRGRRGLGIRRSSASSVCSRSEKPAIFWSAVESSIWWKCRDASASKSIKRRQSGPASP